MTHRDDKVVSASGEAQSQDEHSGPEEEPVCANCGHRIEPDDIVCPNCGINLVAG